MAKMVVFKFHYLKT